MSSYEDQAPTHEQVERALRASFTAGNDLELMVAGMTPDEIVETRKSNQRRTKALNEAHDAIVEPRLVQYGVETEEELPAEVRAEIIKKRSEMVTYLMGKDDE